MFFVYAVNVREKNILSIENFIFLKKWILNRTLFALDRLLTPRGLTKKFGPGVEVLYGAGGTQGTGGTMWNAHNS